MGEVRDIYERDGIKLHTSVRYSPESNGVAEHTIGALTGAVRAMLHDSAFNTATYVHNRTPMRAPGGRTPYEVLYGTKPDISHSRHH
jgi:hypothetical protein